MNEKMPLVCKSPDGVIVCRFSKLKERLGKGRSDNCIFVPAYLFYMFPEKLESFAPTNVGNMPSEPLSFVLERSKFFLVGATSKFHPAFPVIFAKRPAYVYLPT